MENSLNLWGGFRLFRAAHKTPFESYCPAAGRRLWGSICPWEPFAFGCYVISLKKKIGGARGEEDLRVKSFADLSSRRRRRHRHRWTDIDETMHD